MDLIALEQHFPQNLEPCYDHSMGDGFEVFVDRGDNRRPLMVQVFPDTQMAHLSTSLTDVTLRRARVSVDEWNDVLELSGTTDDEWTKIAVHRDGALIVASLPNKDPDTPVARASPKNRPSAHELSEGSMSDEEEDEERLVYETPTPAGPAEEAPNRLEQERVNLVGRVGTEPRFRTTKNDKLVCNFPLAVHDDTGQTTWHRVVVFGERALKLQGSLEKGQEVEVVGYVHVQEKPDRQTGEVKQSREVWAAVVKKPKAQ